MNSKEKNERLSLALRKNLKKRKLFQKTDESDKTVSSPAWSPSICIHSFLFFSEVVGGLSASFARIR